MVLLGTQKTESVGLAGALVRSLFCGLLNQEKRVAVFVAFSDESGTGDPDGIYLVGGYVAAENLWGEYADQWNDIVLKPKPRIPYLHMREIRREKFQKEHKLRTEDAEQKVVAATSVLESIGMSSSPGQPVLHAVSSIRNYPLDTATNVPLPKEHSLTR